MGGEPSRAPPAHSPSRHEYDRKREFRGTRMRESGQALLEDGHAAVDPQPPAVVAPRVQHVPIALLGAAYLAVYVFLGWISDSDQPFANYSWNPNTGASIAFALIFGRRMIPLMFIAPLFDDLVDDLVTRQMPFPWLLELASAALIGGVYAAAVLFPLHPKRRFSPTLQSTRSLFLLTATTAVSTALVGAGYAGIVIASGQLPPADFTAV